MKEESKRIAGIVSELVSNALNAEASDVKVDIKKEDNTTIITVKDDGKGMEPKTADKVHKILNQPNLEDLEYQYGDLAGNTMGASGLTVVGYLVDEATVESKIGEGTVIRVYRRRK
jgi:anti-sigma regulatory factor (Ser/Thr protein kinase)